jgi:hypothetical protein
MLMVNTDSGITRTKNAWDVSLVLCVGQHKSENILERLSGA